MLKNFDLLFFCFAFVISCTPTSKEKEQAQIHIGHRLFFDPQLSINHTKSCSSCHAPEFAFTDGYRTSVSPLGENLQHNAPSILNASELKTLDWANPEANSLIKQMTRPLFNEYPLELGLHKHIDSFKHYFFSQEAYANWFELAYAYDTSRFLQKVMECLAQYEGQLKSVNSAYDRFLQGEKNALTLDQKVGMKLFLSDTLKCGTCHGGKHFSNAYQTNNKDSIYFNIGLYDVGGRNAYPETCKGLVDKTNKSSDAGKFKVPGLRNVAQTAPYMHDGSVASLEDVITIYARGGRMIEKGPDAGDGKLNPNKHAFIKGFSLSDNEKRQLISFLHALTDTSYLKNPLYQNPFKP